MNRLWVTVFLVLATSIKSICQEVNEDMKIPLDELSIVHVNGEKIKVGDLSDVIPTKFGEPSLKKDHHFGFIDKHAIDLYYRGCHLYEMKGQVFSIDCYSNQYAADFFLSTNDGELRLGDTEEDIEKFFPTAKQFSYMTADEIAYSLPLSMDPKLMEVFSLSEPPTLLISFFGGKVANFSIYY